MAGRPAAGRDDAPSAAARRAGHRRGQRPGRARSVERRQRPPGNAWQARRARIGENEPRRRSWVRRPQGRRHQLPPPAGTAQGAARAGRTPARGVVGALKRRRRTRRHIVSVRSDDDRYWKADGLSAPRPTPRRSSAPHPPRSMLAGQATTPSAEQARPQADGVCSQAGTQAWPLVAFQLLAAKSRSMATTAVTSRHHPATAAARRGRAPAITPRGENRPMGGLGLSEPAARGGSACFAREKQRGYRCPVESVQWAPQMGFTGYILDVESGLLHARARMYSPELGRFISRDPINYTAGFHLYAFVRNSPGNHLDPFGLFDITWRDGWRWNEDKVKAAEESIQRVKTHVDSLLSQIDPLMKKYESCPECYGDILGKLAKLKDMLTKMSAGIDSKTHGLNLRMDYLPEGVDARWKDEWGDNGLTLDVGWFRLDRDAQDKVMFHEISHEFNTDDGQSGNDFNRGETLANTYTIGKSGMYKVAVAAGDKMKAAGKCCCGK